MFLNFFKCFYFPKYNLIFLLLSIKSKTIIIHVLFKFTTPTTTTTFNKISWYAFVLRRLILIQDFKCYVINKQIPTKCFYSHFFKISLRTFCYQLLKTLDGKIIIGNFN